MVGMFSFRRIASEIHRRSVWQVLSVYLVTSWGVLEVVDVLAQSYGLPDWAPPFALVLLLIGLPIVLATAIVQEGGPSQEKWTVSDSGSGDGDVLGGAEPRLLHLEANEPERPEASGSVQEREGAQKHTKDLLETLFTWRNAILGGVLAFALLGVVVAGYFVLWATGIGPVGSLVAQGALDEQNRVVVADFGNATTDPHLGNAITEALRVDLDQSPTITVADPSYVNRVLARMEDRADDRLTPEIALELAQREGLKAVIRGDVAPVGEGFLLTAAIVAAEDGRTLASFREAAAQAGDLIPAMNRLSGTIRERAGESLPSIRRGEPLEAVTTSSLEALRLYSRATQLNEQGEAGEAAALLEEAVELDPAFAMAWRKLAVIRTNANAPADQVVSATTEAWEHRHRLTEKERHQTEAFYATEVTADRRAAERAYRRVLASDPDDPVALNNLGLLLLEQDRYREARELLERAVTGPGETMVAHVNLVRALTALAALDEAERAVERLGERHPDRPHAVAIAAFLAFHRGNGEAGHGLARSLADDRALAPIWQLGGSLFPILPDLAAGRIVEAREHIEGVVRVAFREGWGDLALPLALGDLGVLGKVSRDPTAVSSIMAELELEERFHAMDPQDRPYAALIRALVHADRVQEARDLYENWQQDVAVGGLGAAYEEERTLALARLQGAEGMTRRALATLENLPAARGCDRCYRLERAELLLRLGRSAEAVEILESQATEPRALGRMGFTVHHLPRRVLALELLGPLYEETGDTTAAVEAYRAFARAWADADAELQPRVARARERAAVLADGSP